MDNNKDENVIYVKVSKSEYQGNEYIIFKYGGSKFIYKVNDDYVKIKV